MARSVDEMLAERYGIGSAKSAKPAKKLPGASIEDSARAAAQKYGLDEKIFLRLIRQESSGDTSAVSPKGAIGLGQLMPDTARELGVDPTKPLENLDGSARYLKQQLDRFGSYDLALAAYNAGPGAVDEAGGVPDFPETQGYVKRIMGDAKPKRTVDEMLAERYGAGASGGRTTAVGSGPSYPTSSRPQKPGFLGSLGQTPSELLHTLRGGINPEQFAAEVSRHVSDIAGAEGGDPEAASRLGARGMIAGATTSLLPGGPALKAGPTLAGALAARLGLGALGGAAGGAAEAATSGEDMLTGALHGGAFGAVLNPAFGGIEAGIAGIVKARLAKRLTEMELESAGRVAAPKDVKEIADLVRTSQELEPATRMPPEPGVVRLPAGANRATARRLAKLEIERTGGTPTKAEVERMADLLENGGTLPRTPIAPEPGVHDIPMEPAAVRPMREGGPAPEPGMVGLEPTIRATPADFGVPPEPGSIEVAAARAAGEPVPFKPPGGKAPPAPEVAPTVATPGEVVPLETQAITPEAIAGGQAPEPGAFVPPEKAGRIKGVEKPAEFKAPGKKAPEAQAGSGFVPPEKIPTAMDDVERFTRAGKPVPEKIANSARAEVATAIGADAGPVERVLQALRKAPRIINRQKALIRAERGRRAAAGLARRPEGGGGAAGYRMQKSAMAGEMTALDFEALHNVVPQADMDALHNMVYTTSKLDLFERMTAERGLTSMFSGKLPTTDELMKLRAVFGDAFVKEVLGKRGNLAKLGDIALQTLGGWRSFITSYDLSAPLQQGLFAAAGNPKEAARAFGSMFKSAVSQKAFDELATQITSRPTYLLMRRSGLGLTDMGHILSDREEAFASHWVEKIPGVGASNRAYVAFLNKMRADIFDKMIREGRASGVNPNEDLLFTQQVADFVNDATGRGKLGKVGPLDFKRHADLLNAGFFSPRLMASRVRLLNPGLYIHQNPVVRKQALRSLLGMTAAGSTIMALAKANGADVETDPKATDFGKVRFGNTRYDVFGGFSQYARLAANMMPFAGGPNEGTRLDYLGRFAQGKASPAAGFALDLLRGKDFKGDEIATPQWVADRFMPMMLQDIYDAMQEWGPSGTLMALPALFGVRMQTYDG